MAENINITAEALSAYLSQFQSEMAKMDTLLAEIQTATSDAKGNWQGAASDAVMGQIENFQKVFDQVKEQNTKYVTFLNSVISKYTAADNRGISSVESNIGSYSINQ